MLKSKYFSRYSRSTSSQVFSATRRKTNLPFPPIRQSGVAMLLQAFPPSSHRPIRHPDDLSCFPPGDPLRHRFQQHVLHFHHPLHFGAGIRSAPFQSLASRSSSLLKRTHHLLIRPDKSYVNDTRHFKAGV